MSKDYIHHQQRGFICSRMWIVTYNVKCTYFQMSCHVTLFGIEIISKLFTHAICMYGRSFEGWTRILRGPGRLCLSAFCTVTCNKVEWRTVLVDNSRPPGREFSCFNGTWRSSTSFTNVRRWTLLRASWIQCTFQHPVLSCPICSLFSDSVNKLCQVELWI